MPGLLKNELIKLFSKKQIYIYMSIIFIMTIIPAMIFRFMETNVVMVAQSFPVENLKMNAGILLPIFLSILVGDIITEEYKNGTLKIPLVHPVTRVQLFNSKVILLVIALIILLLFSLIISYGIGIIFFEWGTHLQIGNISYASSTGILVTIRLHFIAVLPLIAFGTVILAIALKLTSSGAVVGISIGIIFVLNILSQISELIRPLLISTYFNPLVFVEDPQENMLGVLIISIYGLVSYFIGRKIFNEKDLVY